MTSPLLNILMQYAGSTAAGILVGLIFKMYFAAQVQKRMQEYQGEIVRSHAKILQMEEKNGRLESRIREIEKSFSKEQFILN